MARTVLRSALQTRVRRWANQETNTGSSAFVSDTELQELIDEGAAILYDELRAAHGDDYYVNTTTINVLAATDKYNLPSDFLHLLAVRVKINGVWNTINRISRQDIDYYKNLAITLHASDVVYNLSGTQSTSTTSVADIIQFFPLPSSAYTAEVDYVPTVSNYVSASDVTYNGIDGWEDAIVWRAIAIIRNKGREDSAFEMGMFDRATDRIRSLAGSRDARPARITDVKRELNPKLPWWLS